MSKISVEIQELRKNANGDTIKDLANFLEEKLGGIDLDMTGNEIKLDYGEEETAPSRPTLRLLLRKFLHKADLKDFRVISGREGAFIIKQKKGISE
ncbi:MAG: hypothetical protein JSV35_07615 [Candidatus Bathyarchaeota archaeon]|nr:MAG: hypothetical protein JSV35_07615 [Candidatus Bathyarchaeota archaeon]